jgi:hypothetical protein
MFARVGQFQIGQGVAEGAEHQQLVVGQRLLVADDLEEGVEFWIRAGQLLACWMTWSTSARNVSIGVSPVLTYHQGHPAVVSISVSYSCDRFQMVARMSDSRGARPKTQLATWRRMVVSMNWRFADRHAGGQHAAIRSDQVVMQRFCSGV